MPDFTVHSYGTDTSGRTIYMTAFMHDWWEAVVTALGFRPTVVQGAFMTRNGGGAADSAGYHDQGGCMDVRTWDLTGSQVDALVRACRERGGAAWRRDKTPAHGGMDPHCHITLGSDSPLSAGAAASWRSYLAGDDGLAGGRTDYEWRPSPLVTTPPEDDMPYTEKQLTDLMRSAVKAELEPITAQNKRIAQRMGGLIRDVRSRVKDNPEIIAKLDEMQKALEDDA